MEWIKKHCNFIIVISIIIVIVSFMLIIYFYKRGSFTPEEEVKDKGFYYNLIEEVNRETEENVNYLISPLSVGNVLSVLRDGASGVTYDELNNALKSQTFIKNINVNDKISIANALFINNAFKDLISNSYIDKIENNYNSDAIFDDMQNPDVINNWVDDKTYGMIPNLVDEISNDFVMGIVNAIALDVNWKESFNCNFTKDEDFTKVDGNNIEVSMMYEPDRDGDLSYIESDKAVGIIKPYATYDGVDLEYVAILPNDNVFDYVNQFDENEFKTLMDSEVSSSSSIHIDLSLPKYSYDYNMAKFKTVLSHLGLNSMFDVNLADFSLMTGGVSTLFVEDAIHKTKIELNEMGTKAAAATYVSLDLKTIESPEYYKTISVTFNKPFVYLIKEKDSNDIIFFGVVYAPESEDNTCS
ncbi:MAG: serpin family protein [Bacilli bacterium]|nr:serpin family protein [Bacilli bacterium]